MIARAARGLLCIIGSALATTSALAQPIGAGSAPASLIEPPPPSATPANAATLVLRRGENAPPGSVVSANAEGVVVAGGSAAPVLVPWDRVLRLDGIVGAETWRADGVDVWRGWERLERGDAIAAEPVFERVVRGRAGARGPTTARALEGLLRCRLERGARALALETWLAWQDARVPVAGPQVYQRREAPALAAIEDAGYALVPSLPPLWTGERLADTIVDTAEEDHEHAPPDARGRGAQLASIYAAAARFARGELAELGPKPIADRGADLAWLVAAAQSPDAATRRVGTEGLRRVLDAERTPWVRAWAHVALGRGMALEADDDERRRAALELLRVPAELGWAVPHLAETALVDAAAILDTLGDTDGAAAIRAELAARRPHTSEN